MLCIEYLLFLGQLLQDDALIGQSGAIDNPLADSLTKLRSQIDSMTASLTQIREVWDLNSEFGQHACDGGSLTAHPSPHRL